jgi:hypothetical protein
MNPAQMQKCQEALNRASNPRSILNMAMVVEAALAAGITDAIPGENVLTFNAWKAKGRVVAKGQKALCKLPVFYTKENADGETEKRMGTSAVFHISQTVEANNALSSYEKRRAAYLAEHCEEPTATFADQVTA